jgi:hypothetical protein
MVSTDLIIYLLYILIKTIRHACMHVSDSVQISPINTNIGPIPQLGILNKYRYTTKILQMLFINALRHILSMGFIQIY